MFSLASFARRARRDRPLGAHMLQERRRPRRDNGTPMGDGPSPVRLAGLAVPTRSTAGAGTTSPPRPPCRCRAVTMQRGPDRLVSTRHQPSRTSQPPTRTYRPRSRPALGFWFRPLKFRLPAPPLLFSYNFNYSRCRQVPLSACWQDDRTKASDPVLADRARSPRPGARPG